MNKPFDWAVDNQIFRQTLEFIEGMVITRFDVNPNMTVKNLLLRLTLRIL